MTARSKCFARASQRSCVPTRSLPNRPSSLRVSRLRSAKSSRARSRKQPHLQQYRKRLRTKNAKRTIPMQLLTDLLDAGDALRSDTKTIRATLQCPGDAAR